MWGTRAQSATMDTDLTAIKAALTDISDTQFAALFAVARCNKPRRSGACALHPI